MRSLFVVAVALWMGCAGTHFTWAQAHRLKAGMTKAEVVQIMGRPYLTRVLPDGKSNYVWSYAEATGASRSLSLVFDHEALVAVPELPE